MFKKNFALIAATSLLGATAFASYAIRKQQRRDLERMETIIPIVNFHIDSITAIDDVVGAYAHMSYDLRIEYRQFHLDQSLRLVDVLLGVKTFAESVTELAAFITKMRWLTNLIAFADVPNPHYRYADAVNTVNSEIGAVYGVVFD